MQDNVTYGNSAGADPEVNVSNPAESTNAGNLESQNGVDNVDYKQRYSESTREAQRILEENKTLKQQLESQKPYVEVGTQFTLKYENDPEFRQLIDSASQKQAEGKELTQKEQDAVAEAGGTPQQGVAQLDPDTLAYIKQKKMEDSQNAALEQQRFAELISEIEADKSSEIDKYTIKYFDPDIKQVKVENPVRIAIAASAKAIMAMHRVDKETAYRKAAKLLLNEDEMFEEAEYKGQLSGLQSQSVASYGGSKGFGRKPQADPGELSESDKEMISSYGDSIDPKILADIKRRTAIAREKNS